MQLDVCVVAGRRPDLLARTLASFHENLLANFSVRQIFVNIDPIFGDADDERRCIDLVEAYDRKAVIFRPPAPNFCGAVKRLWSATQAATIFHLEDDWVANRPVFPSEIEALMAMPMVREVGFNTIHKNWDTSCKGVFPSVRSARRLFSVALPLRRRLPAFSTSPAFLNGDFARRSAELMDVALDPEKQFRNGLNPPLERFSKHYKIALCGNGPDFPITDIGREWRDVRRIEKRTADGRSTWTIAA